MIQEPPVWASVWVAAPFNAAAPCENLLLFWEHVRRKWGSAGVLLGLCGARGALLGWRQEADSRACWGREEDVLGAARWGTWQVPVQLGHFLWLSAACVWKECASCLFHQINVCILQPCGCCILVWCVCAVFCSCFSKDYWGPSLSVGKVESGQKLQSCFPPRRSSQLYFPPVFCLCPGRNTPTCTDVSLSLSLFFPLQNPHLFCIAYFNNIFCFSLIKLASYLSMRTASDACQTYTHCWFWVALEFQESPGF